MRFLGRLLVLVVVLSTSAAACSTGDDGETVADDATTTEAAETDQDDATTTTVADPDPEDADPEDEEPVEPTASFRGVTEDTIRLGVALWDTSVFGFGFLGDPVEVWDALTGAINTDGGVNGRTLEASVAGFSPASGEEMLAACLTLTQDDQVFAVLGGMRGDANFCVSEQNETIHLGSQVSAAGELLERARAPIAGILTDGTAREEAFIEALAEQGWFDGATAVGVHYDGTATADRADAAVRAAMADAGVEIAITMNIDDLVLDEDTLESQTEIMQQQVTEAGIDRMVIVGAAATGLVTYGELGFPLAAVDSTNFTTAVSGGIDPAALDGTIASAVRLDLVTDAIDDETQACIDDAAAALPDARFEQPGPGVTNSADDPNYWNYTVLACRDLSLFVQAATAAGVELTNESFAAGLESLTDTSLPQIPFVSFGPGKYNGNDTLRLVEFDGDADEDGELVALGDAVDLTP